MITADTVALTAQWFLSVSQSGREGRREGEEEGERERESERDEETEQSSCLCSSLSVSLLSELSTSSAVANIRLSAECLHEIYVNTFIITVTK